jgi:hypothetical protein
MLTKDDFIRHVLSEAPRTKARAAKNDSGHIEGFDFADDAPDSQATEDTRFVTPLLQAGFGDGQGIPRATVIRSSDAVAKYIPDEVRYWPKTPKRPHHTLLIEANLTHRELLAIPAFKSHQLAHLDIAEDAVARLVAEALEGFQHGAEGLDASALKGQKQETLCVVSIIDSREERAGRIACFGTFNAKTQGLETFFLTRPSSTWDRAEARDRLSLIYERQFKKLGEAAWQEAFTATDERKQAEKLLEVCTKKNVVEKEIQESILDLLDTIARGFGLRKKPNVERRLQAFPLPGEHDIGIDPEERENKHGGTNPFSGVTLRDDHSRLLGYIVYPLKTKSDAEKLRQHLEKHNRFHNVLVVYPDANQATIELWQGREQLTGKLRKGQSHKDAADVVNLLSRFFVVSKAKVRNPAELAQELAYRARYLRRLALRQLEDEPEKGPLRNLYNAFKVALVHDQTEDEFADAFAQTITYGLLTARWLGNDQLATAGDRFTRQSALKYLPAASPFLNDLFKSALSAKMDEHRGRLLWLVDDVADLLDRIDVTYVFGAGDKKSDTTTDPVIHFYEPFLAAYDNDQKKKRGVFFTPRPVVSYIVRAIHEMLQREFGLEDGLASVDTWTDVAKRIDGLKPPGGAKASDPFVCILDPATGTGTFLYECIGVIERTMKDRWCRDLGAESWNDERILNRWREYVAAALLPRLYGYELMIASYAVAHLKLSFKLAETGCELDAGTRFHLYLTNSLEPPTDIQPDLEGFSAALAGEARAVNKLKRIQRFSVVLGNPPYSVTSFNQNPFIDGLMGDYKKHVRGEQGLVALSDDYLKFIRLSQEILKATGAGVWGMITNHGYLRGVIHRGVRRELLDQFAIFTVLDLHGDSNVGEMPPPGLANENVFDIQQGVCIAVAAHACATSDARIRHSDCWGPRTAKYDELARRSLSDGVWASLLARAPSFFLIPFDDTNLDEYQAFPSLTELMPVNSCGVKTHRDGFLTDVSKATLTARFEDVAGEHSLSAIRERYSVKDTTHWRLKDAREKIASSDVRKHIKPITYRPFDDRWIYYNPAIIEKGDSKYPTLRHMLHGNVALISARIQAAGACNAAFVSRSLVEMKTGEATRSCTVFPLYLLPDAGARQRHLSTEGRRPNLDASVLRRIADRLGIKANGTQELLDLVTPEDLLHYVYAILYSPGYRKRYAEYLRSEFPRIPISSEPLFRALVPLGARLVGLHLLEEQVDTSVAGRVGALEREVEKVSWSNDTVWIDKRATCGFAGVSEDVWLFEVGGYQICEKWLKSRKGLTLSKGDVAHYERVVCSLRETIQVMSLIDRAIELHGGWPGAFATKASAS